MLKKILIVIAALIAGVLLFAATKPDTFHFERAIAIDAGPERIAPLLTDFHNWGAWSPWEHLDPAMKRTYTGPASGPGAIYEWSGNSEVGSGRMEIAAATDAQIDIKLDFLEPMATSNQTRFVLAPANGATNVVWSMDGQMNYMSKLMTVFVSMDKLLSKDFETGLAKLKAAAEKAT